ncbi:CMD domain protein [Microbacterium sp. CFBP9034]|uniref:CMD domain protein n=1 Tax=Microbacterium sp. CFBP9034 TaxID=3096540 RepID=UPI002A6A7CC4|nr:CMD domain protein [Microbacterium sp. CFBP9034]MDY0910195.1 CMD domain protein [Microbacterium sp. CFBP9034]
MTSQTIDVVDDLTGLRPGAPLDAVRRRRPVTRDQLQASFEALFSPVDDSEFPVAERALVAAFATRVTTDDETSAAYADRARRADPERAEAVLEEASAAATAGPFGAYVEAGLQGESTDGARYEPGPATRDLLGDRLAAALAHAHLLTARPREASAPALDRLLDAGWSIDGIVTLSQLVSFLAFQQRVAAGLRVLASSATPTTEEVSA